MIIARFMDALVGSGFPLGVLRIVLGGLVASQGLAQWVSGCSRALLGDLWAVLCASWVVLGGVRAPLWAADSIDQGRI